MKYPEVYSLEESLSILDKYKNELSQEGYENIKSNICNHAIENMYANEEDIIDLVAIQNGADAEELIKRDIKNFLK